MSHSLWYYSRDDLKRGPVTSNELHRLAQRSKLHPDDLVWCHGMAQWVPARTIRGIFPEDDDAGLLTDIFDAPSEPDESAEPDVGSQAKRLRNPKLGPPDVANANYYDRPVEERPNRQFAASLGEQWSTTGRKTVRWIRVHSRNLIIVSLLLALTSRGCDRLGQQEVERRQADLQLIETQFSAIHDKQIAKCQDRILQLRSLAQLTLAQSQELQTCQADLTHLQNTRSIELARFKDDSWHRLRVAAESARSSYSYWSLFRELLVLSAIFALVAGCFTRFYRGDHTERLLCGGLLLIVAMALLIFPNAL